MKARPRRWRSRWTIILLAVVTLFYLLTLIPIVPWQARCYEEPVPGPYRPIFVDEVSAWLSQNDVYHWRINNTIFLRILPVFDGYDIITRDTILLNIGKISSMLEDDVTIDGTTYPKPPAVRQFGEEKRERGTYNGLELCRAAIQRSPADPPQP